MPMVFLTGRRGGKVLYVATLELVLLRVEAAIKDTSKKCGLSDEQAQKMLDKAPALAKAIVEATRND